MRRSSHLVQLGASGGGAGSAGGGGGGRKRARAEGAEGAGLVGGAPPLTLSIGGGSGGGVGGGEVARLVFLVDVCGARGLGRAAVLACVWRTLAACAVDQLRRQCGGDAAVLYGFRFFDARARIGLSPRELDRVCGLERSSHFFRTVEESGLAALEHDLDIVLSRFDVWERERCTSAGRARRRELLGSAELSAGALLQASLDEVMTGFNWDDHGMAESRMLGSGGGADADEGLARHCDTVVILAPSPQSQGALLALLGADAEPLLPEPLLPEPLLPEPLLAEPVLSSRDAPAAAARALAFFRRYRAAYGTTLSWVDTDWPLVSRESPEPQPQVDEAGGRSAFSALDAALRGLGGQLVRAAALLCGEAALPPPLGGGLGTELVLAGARSAAVSRGPPSPLFRSRPSSPLSAAAAAAAAPGSSGTGSPLFRPTSPTWSVRTPPALSLSQPTSEPSVSSLTAPGSAASTTSSSSSAAPSGARGTGRASGGSDTTGLEQWSGDLLVALDGGDTLVVAVQVEDWAAPPRPARVAESCEAAEKAKQPSLAAEGVGRVSRARARSPVRRDRTGRVPLTRSRSPALIDEQDLQAGLELAASQAQPGSPHSTGSDSKHHRGGKMPRLESLAAAEALTELCLGAPAATDSEAGTSQLEAGASQLVAGASQLEAGASQLVVGASQLEAGASQLEAGASQLEATRAAQLEAGAAQPESGSSQLEAGASQLEAGASQPLPSLQVSQREHEPVVSRLLLVGAISRNAVPLKLLSGAGSEGCMLVCTPSTRMSGGEYLGVMRRLDEDGAVGLLHIVRDSRPGRALLVPWTRSAALVVPIGAAPCARPASAALAASVQAGAFSRGVPACNAHVLSNALPLPPQRDRASNAVAEAAATASWEALVLAWLGGRAGELAPMELAEQQSQDAQEPELAELLASACNELRALLAAEPTLEAGQGALPSLALQAEAQQPEQQVARPEQHLSGTAPRAMGPSQQKAELGDLEAAFAAALRGVGTVESFWASLEAYSAAGGRRERVESRLVVAPDVTSVLGVAVDAAGERSRSNHACIQVLLRLWAGARDPLPKQALKEAHTFLLAVGLYVKRAEFIELVALLRSRFEKRLPKTVAKIVGWFLDEQDDSHVTGGAPEAARGASKEQQQPPPPLPPSDATANSDKPFGSAASALAAGAAPTSGFVSPAAPAASPALVIPALPCLTPVVMERSFLDSDGGIADPLSKVGISKIYSLNHFTSSMANMNKLVRIRKPVPSLAMPPPALPAQHPRATTSGGSSSSNSSSSSNHSSSSSSSGSMIKSGSHGGAFAFGGETPARPVVRTVSVLETPGPAPNGPVQVAGVKRLFDVVPGHGSFVAPQRTPLADSRRQLIDLTPASETTIWRSSQPQQQHPQQLRPPLAAAVPGHGGPVRTNSVLESPSTLK